MNSKPPRFTEIDGMLERSAGASGAGPLAIGTRDHDVVRRWAARHHAEPATGEATASGPATVQMRDDGAGIRFNFPGFSPFRPISWEEWFEHFDQHELTFVYEEEIADRAYAVWHAGGATHGHDRDDWYEAERQLKGPGGRPMGRYRLTKGDIGL